MLMLILWPVDYGKKVSVEYSLPSDYVSNATPCPLKFLWVLNSKEIENYCLILAYIVGNKTRAKANFKVWASIKFEYDQN